MSTLAERWADAMRLAGTLDPTRIALAVLASSDSGLRAQRFDATGGGRTTRVPCPEHERKDCEDGPEPHSHLVTSDPTGNAAVRGRSRFNATTDDRARLDRAVRDMIRHAAVVLDWVCGKRPDSWSGVVAVNARLMPGTVQAGVDVDDERHLPHAIVQVERAVAVVADIARDHLPREPSQDEQHWTAGLGPNDICAWHESIAPHGRYRRPRVAGTNICQACISLAEMGHKRPPDWLLEAEVERESKPKAWTAALSRYADELGLTRERSA